MELWLTSSTITQSLARASNGSNRATEMKKRPTAPPTRKYSRSLSSGRSELIAKDKTKKRSAKERTVLDDLSHGTCLARLSAKTQAARRRGFACCDHSPIVVGISSSGSSGAMSFSNTIAWCVAPTTGSLISSDAVNSSEVCVTA
jgi:hypothetical protein